MLDSLKIYYFKVFCSKCGADNDDSAKFCTKCGNQLTLVESKENENTVSSQGRLNQYKSSNTRNKPPTSTSGIGFKRAKRGGVIFGICKGLENSGRGSAGMWRVILSLVSFFLTGIPVIVYIIAGLALPVEDN